MTLIQKASALLLILTGSLLVVACGGGATETDTSAATPTPTPTPSPSPSVTPSPSATPTPGVTPAPTPATPTPAPAPTSVYRLVGSYDKTECVFDSSTGLTWEGKPTSGFRAAGITYSNFDDANSLQKNIYGTRYKPTQAEIDASINTIGYVNAVNASGLCGYNNWRLPSLNEFLTINAGATTSGGPYRTSEMDTWFPNASTWYWTSTPDATNIAGAYTFMFGGSGHFQQSRTALWAVRLVR